MKSGGITEDFAKVLGYMAVDWQHTPRAKGRHGPGRADPLPYLFRRFEMTDALSLGGSADAYLIYDDNGTLTRVQNQDGTDHEFTVVDRYGEFSKLATLSTADHGAYGTAIKRHDASDWEILRMCHIAYQLEFAASEDFETTDSYWTATAENYFQGYDPADEFSTLIIYNRASRFEGSNGAHGEAVWDDVRMRYTCRQLDCP